MTADLAALAAAVDTAVPLRTRAEWEAAMRRQSGHLVRRRIYRECGGEFGFVIRSRSELPHQGVRAAHDHSASADDRGVVDGMRSAFRDIADGCDTDTVFARVTRSFLAGDLPIPRRPERVVVEVDGTGPCDGVVRDGLLRLKGLGCRIALGDFTGRDDQRRLLPFADFVKIDSRDLDIEGRPLLDLAVSRGADLIAEHVDTVDGLRECRTTGFALVQGRVFDHRPPVRPLAVLASAARR